MTPRSLCVCCVCVCVVCVCACILDLISSCFPFSKVIKQLIQSRIKYEEAIKEMEPNEQEFYRQTECTDTFTAFYQSQK